MFCPRCGQERISQETSFCSRCGFLLTAVSDLLLTDGVPGKDTGIERADPSAGMDSPRRRGVKQGLFLILLTLVLIPLFGILLRFAIGMPNPWPLGVFIFLMGGGGILRTAYALMFEPSHRNSLPEAEARRMAALGAAHSGRELSGGDESSYIPPGQVGVGSWRDTNDLQPNSVTERTTRLLEKDRE